MCLQHCMSSKRNTTLDIRLDLMVTQLPIFGLLRIYSLTYWCHWNMTGQTGQIAVHHMCYKRNTYWQAYHRRCCLNKLSYGHCKKYRVTGSGSDVKLTLPTGCFGWCQLVFHDYFTTLANVISILECCWILHQLRWKLSLTLSVT